MNMMRKNNNRNNNRNRNGGGGRRYNNNGGGGNRNNQNDGQNLQRQKHHATQMMGKYNDLLRNAQNNGDRVDVEYYLQHIDHYTRVLSDIAAIEAERFAAQRESQIIPGGPNDPNAAPQGDNNGGNNDDAAADGAANAGDANGGEAFTPSNQPRMTRHPRQARPQQTENTETDPNSNTSEIPLPGNILPPI